MKRLHHHFQTAFSLVEATLAIGILSVGALSVVGLLGTSLSGTRQAQRDSVLGTIASSVMADLRAIPFDGIAQADLSTQNTTKSYVSLPDTLQDSLLYFDAQGGRVAADSSEAIYECLVRKVPDPTFKGVSGGVHNLVRVELEFTWPLAASNNRNQRPERFKFYGSIARF